MALNTAATIFDYCERGTNPGFWAEPLNAITNGGFILAALTGAVLIAQQPSSQRSLWHYFFVLNFIAIGIGSFLFHTIPNAQTVQADTTPIGIFMLTYLVFAMRRFVGLSWFLTAAALAAFIGLMVVAFNVQCWQGQIYFLNDLPPGARGRCLNGSLGYGPALLFIWLTAAWLATQRHPAARLVFLAGVAFIVSLTFRSVDRELCSTFMVFGTRVGTHFIWHVLNSITLFLLLLAAIRYTNIPEILPPRPQPRNASFGVS